MLQITLSELIISNLQHAFPGSMITITKVKVSPDLGVANIYLSVFKANPVEVLQSVELAGSEIRYNLGKKIKNQVRVVPELHFHIDDSLDYIDKIERLLKN